MTTTFIPFARTAGGKLAKRSALDIQAALDARNERVTLRGIIADFAADEARFVRVLRELGIVLNEVAIADLGAYRELAALNG